MDAAVSKSAAKSLSELVPMVTIESDFGRHCLGKNQETFKTTFEISCPMTIEILSGTAEPFIYPIHGYIQIAIFLPRLEKDSSFSNKLTLKLEVCFRRHSHLRS